MFSFTAATLDDAYKLFVVDAVFIVEVVLQKDDIQGSMTASSPVASSAQPSGCIRIPPSSAMRSSIFFPMKQNWS